jgi:PAS domain S-box-containing protein
MTAPADDDGRALARQLAVPDVPAAHADGYPEGITVAARPIRVLVVGVPDIVEHLSTAIRATGLRTEIHIETEPDAIERALATASYDAQFIDGGPDGALGLERLRMAQSLGNYEPTILVIERAAAVIEETAYEAGAYACILTDEITSRIVGRVLRMALDRGHLRWKLKAREDKLDKILAHAPIVLFVLDELGSPVVIDGEAVALLGPSFEELRAHSWIGPSAPAELAAAVRRALAGDRVTEILHLARRTLQTTFGPLAHDGAIVGVFGIATDITDSVRYEEALRVREEYFRLLTEQAHGFLCVVDRDGIVTYQSPGIESMLGYTPEEAVGHDVLRLVHSDDLPRMRALFDALRAGRTATETATVKMEHADGSTRSVEIAWRDLSHRPTIGGIVVTARDVTDRVLAEQARARAQEEVRQANAELEVRVADRTLELRSALERLDQRHAAQQRFIADATHDLRTPLTTIRGEADLLRERAGDDGLRASLDTIRHEAERLEALSMDLLLLATLDEAMVSQRSVRFRLDEIVLDAIGLLRRVTRERGAHWDIAIDDEITIAGDPAAMTRAVMNVLDNAIKYSPQGSTIAIGLSLTDGTARLLVTDHGRGIADWDLPYVFDRFYRGDGASCAPGTGLGLSIVRRVVETHGGSVALTSTPEHGTTVTITLPAVEPA